jgi:lysyl endopeptidase
MYLYAEDGSMVYGPITSDFNFEDGKFLCDIIKGEYLLIRIISSNEDVPKINLGIRNIVHGFQNLFPTQSQSKSSGACNNDIECFNDWRIESNAVARVILTGGTWTCSGSLINNNSSDFHPYFLTAFHNIDIGGADENSQYYLDHTLQQFEIDDVYDMTFQFDYKFTTCGGSTVASYQTFNHATFKSAWYTSDFALVELTYSYALKNTPGITLLGWDKTGNTPAEGICIHHPAGDVMKISFDDDNLTETGWLSNSGSNYWRVIWDDGIVEHGSSGSPLLDQNNRIIGQLSGGNYLCGSADLRNWYGCFYRSWTGGGTNTTRLSNWLDPNDAGTDTLNSRLTCTGPDIVCSSGASYTSADLPAGSSIIWYPSYYLTLSSAQGSNPCTFQANGNGVHGWIDATVTFNGNHYSAVQKAVWVGAANTPTSISKYTEYDPQCINEYIHFICNDESSNPWDLTYYNWTVYASADIINGQGTTFITVCPYGEGDLTLSVNATNECGSSDYIYSDAYYIEDCSFRFALYPNPATDYIKIELPELPVENATVAVYNSQSIKIISTTMADKEKTIDISGLPRGVYYVTVVSNSKGKGKDKISTERFIKD